MATRICVVGACGRMGRRILELAATVPDLEIAGAVDVPERAGDIFSWHTPAGNQQVPITDNLEAALRNADVLIDFTQPEATAHHAETAAALGKGCVVGTTGLNEAQRRALERAAQQIPIVFSPNMSVGVNLLFKLTRDVARILGTGYNVEIIEVHHNQKKDSPSGTAVRLAECVAEALGLSYAEHTVHGRVGNVGARPVEEIGIHAVRGGDVVGEHTVCFFGTGERIELVHKAHNRDNFARGALLAAKFVHTAPPRMYDMQDVLGLR